MTQMEATRTQRQAGRKRGRRRGLIVGALALALVIGVGAILTALLVDPPASESEPGPAVPIGEPATLTLFGVQGTGLSAVVGTAPGRPSVVIPIPSNSIVPLPDTGPSTVRDGFNVSGAQGRTAVANLLGTWIPHFALVDQPGLARVVDRAGGITVNVPRVRLGDRTVGPGPVQMSGSDVVSYLSVRDASERQLRWAEVVAGLFAEPVPIDDRSVVSSDDLGAATRALAGVNAASVTPLPTETMSGGLEFTSAEDAQRTIAEAFAIVRGVPTRVMIMEGVEDCFGCSQVITDVLLQNGYRVSAYGRSGARAQAHTLIHIALRDLQPQAEQIRRLLKEGRIQVTGATSGFGDITILVGQDYVDKMGKSAA